MSVNLENSFCEDVPANGDTLYALIKPPVKIWRIIKFEVVHKGHGKPMFRSQSDESFFFYNDNWSVIRHDCMTGF